MKSSFVFYKSYYECIKNLPKDIQLEIYDAIFEYSFDGKEPKLEGLSKGIFAIIKPTIDSSNAKYKASIENGKKGGRPKKIKTQEKPNKNPEETQTKPSENLNVNENENVNVNEKENVNNNNYNNIDEFLKQNWETLTPFEYETLMNYCGSVGEEKVLLAIQEAIKQKKKTLRYVEGILRNWKNRGLSTISEILEDSKKSEDDFWND